MSFAAMSSMVHRLQGDCNWCITAVVRTFLAMILAAGLAVSAGARLAFFRPPVLWVRSIAGSMALLSNFYTLPLLPVADVLALTNMFPIWMAVISWPMLRIRPTADVWLSVACGTSGVLIMQYEEMGQSRFTWLIALAASFFSAVALTGLHKLRTIDARSIVAHFSAVSLLFSTATLLLFERESLTQQKVTQPVVLLLLGVGLTATIGQLFLTKAFASGHPSRVSVVGLSQVVFALLIEVLLFQRQLRLSELAGMALVITPCAWLLLRRRSARLPSA